MSYQRSFHRGWIAAVPLALCVLVLITMATKVTRLPSDNRAVHTPRHSSVAPSSDVRDVPTVTLRPLPVSHSSVTHEWTKGDATSPEIIEKLAHNPEEFVRLVEENDRIKRRQLVYRKITVPLLVERAEGRPIEGFTLPGLDGREVEVEVTETRLDGTSGSVIGRVKGQMNSSVSLGFSNGCESFNVISPDENLFLTADAREPGEVLVKEIDPNEYNPPAGMTSDFIRYSK